MQKVYGDECLSCPTIYEWFKRLKGSRKYLNDDEHLGRTRSSPNEENVKIVREFVKKKPKSSFQRTKLSMLYFILV